MIIECPSCKARYNLSPVLIRGRWGARVRCRKCGNRFDVRNPEIPPPPEAVEPARMEMGPEKKSGAPESSPGPGRSREKESDRSASGGRPRSGGVNAVYYLAGSIGIVLGIAVALLVHSELHRSPTSVPEKTSPDVQILSSRYASGFLGVQLYVIRGAVRDTRKGATSEPIRLRARLFDEKKGVLADKTVLAGYLIAEIRSIQPEMALVPDNTVFKEGWLPFVVFFIDPGAVADFSVTIKPM